MAFRIEFWSLVEWKTEVTKRKTGFTWNRLAAEAD